MDNSYFEVRCKRGNPAWFPCAGRAASGGAHPPWGLVPPAGPVVTKPRTPHHVERVARELAPLLLGLRLRRATVAAGIVS